MCFTLKFQAILPLRGKILNTERKDEASLYKNVEIQSLITGLGLGMKVITYVVNVTKVYNMLFAMCCIKEARVGLVPLLFLIMFPILSKLHQFLLPFF